MPKHEQSIPLHGMETDTALAIALSVFQQLQWKALVATDSGLVGSTPRNWKTYDQQIVVMVEDGTLTISSEMVNGEVMDVRKRNQKHVQAFLTAWEQLSTQPDTASNNQQALADLRTQTVAVIQKEEQEAAEVDSVMKFSKGNLYATYTIIAINILVFILMAFNGAGLFDTNGLVHIKWGSNYAPLTLSGDWWRLVTSVFIHFGIIHLALNMYCLYMAGVYLESMLGKARYIAAYLATGVLGGIASLWWHNDNLNGAGASGAIFGLYGLFLALLTTNLIPKQVRQSLLSSIGIFIVYNLIYGIKGGVDNAAHIGGLLSGFIVGYLYALSLKKEKAGARPMLWMAAVVVLLGFAAAFAYLQQNKVSPQDRQDVVKQIANEGYKGYEAFNNSLLQFDELQKTYFALANYDSVTLPGKWQKTTDSIMLIWNKAASLMEAAQTLDISPSSKAKAHQLLQYINIRKSQTNTMVYMTQVGEQDSVVKRYNTLNDSAEKVFQVALQL